MRILAVTLVLLLALCGTGCGAKQDPNAAAKAAKAAAVKKVASPADSLSPNLVGGVVTGKMGAALLQVKFELAGRPVVGEPLDVDMVVLPQADTIDQFSGTIQGEDGLEVVSGEVLAPTEKPVYGVPVHHSLKLLPKRDGIFTLNATMAIAAGGQSLNPVYSFPVIAGNGLADTATVPMAGSGPGKPSAAAAAH
jgi:hypothetical protein